MRVCFSLHHTRRVFCAVSLTDGSLHLHFGGESQAEKGRGEPPATGIRIPAPPQPAEPSGYKWRSGGSGCQSSAPRGAPPASAHLPGGAAEAQRQAVRVLTSLAKRNETISSASPAILSAPCFSAPPGNHPPCSPRTRRCAGARGRPENPAGVSTMRLAVGLSPRTC